MMDSRKNIYEYDAPQYVDFEKNNRTLDDSNAEDYFNIVHEEINSICGQSAMEENQENLDPKKCGSADLSISRKRRRDNERGHGKIKTPTIPKTPMVLKRFQKLKMMKRTLTNDEIEEYQRREAKMQFAHKRVTAAKDRKILKTRETFVNSIIHFASTSGFKFESDLKLKSDSEGKSLAEKEVAFVAGLRQHVETFNFVPGGTKPIPFIFHGNSKPSTYQKIETLAEKCNKFTTKTPIRFHTKSAADLQREKMMYNAKNIKRTKTIAKTPKLLTKNRVRTIDIPSQAAREEAECEEIKKNQFKATKLNKKIFLPPSLNKKKILPNVRSSLDFGAETTNVRDVGETNSFSAPSEQHKFHAKPVPHKILCGPVGIKPRSKLPTTVPKSPEFSELHATKKMVALLEDSDASNIESMKACPLPVTLSPFKPQLEHKHTDSEPFSFETRDKEMMEKKEQKIKAIYELEKEARKFVANPLPDFCPNLPVKKLKPSTTIEEFNLETEKRATLQHEKWQKMIEKEMLNERESRMFKAKPASVLCKDPFIPELCNNSNTIALIGLSDEERHVPTNLEKRAFERQQRDKLLQEHKEELERQALEKERILLEEEEKEIRKLRDQMVHQAQPIKLFKPVKIERSSKQLTDPKSPNFSERLNAKFKKNH